jgi:hypothetical protein
MRLMVALRGKQRGNGRCAGWRVLVGTRRLLAPTGVHGDDRGAPVRHTLLQQQNSVGASSPVPVHWEVGGARRCLASTDPFNI